MSFPAAISHNPNIRGESDNSSSATSVLKKTAELLGIVGPHEDQVKVDKKDLKLYEEAVAKCHKVEGPIV